MKHCFLLLWVVFCMAGWCWTLASGRYVEPFERQVETAVQKVQNLLQKEKQQLQLASQDQDHTYQDKFALVEHLTHAAGVWVVKLLTRLLGLDAAQHVMTWLEQQQGTTTTTHPAVILHFVGKQSCHLIQEEQVEIELGGVNVGKTKVREVQKVTEYSWNVTESYELYVCLGTTTTTCDNNEDSSSSNNNKLDMTSRTMQAIVTTRTKDPPVRTQNIKESIAITWWMEQFGKFVINNKKKKNATTATTTNDDDDDASEAVLVRTFSIDRDLATTPRRNPQIDHVMEMLQGMYQMVDSKLLTFFRNLSLYPPGHENALIKLTSLNLGDLGDQLPSLLPVFENSTIVPLETLLQLQQQEDMLLEHRLQAAADLFDKNISQPNSAQEELISGKEAVLCELLRIIKSVLWQYEQSILYVENMLREQLYKAIGREITAADFDQYMEFHMEKLFASDYLPTPFSHAIRQPQEYPVGIVAVENETNENQPIQAFSRRIPGGEGQSPIRVPISAATSVELAGDRILSGWVRYQFQEYRSKNTRSSLVARARQFSSYMLLIGTMTGPHTFDPKHAVILQNKDEVIIPLLTEVLPSAKEFKDAIASMSPEQQEFARAFRAMQLESSVFAICLVQLKPQLELLLNLPKGSLSKEIQLTEDLMSLFVDYQIPSNLLSYDGAPNALSTPEKVQVVKTSVEQVLKIISDAKELQLKEEVQKAKTRDAMQHAMQDDFVESAGFESSFDAAPGSIPSAVPRSTPSAAPSSTPSSSPSSLPSKTHATVTQSTSRNLRSVNVEMQSLRGGGSQQPNDTAQPQSLHRKEAQTGVHTSTTAAEDFTAIPGILDAMLEKHDTESFLRSTILKAASKWTRKRQENLLTPPTKFDLVESDIASEKAKAFDLLDAISRSGTLPIASSELHVVVGMTHCFERSLVDTVVQDNVNPILKAEKSALMVASTIFGTATPTALIAGEDNIQRLSASFPKLFVEIDDGINTDVGVEKAGDAASENDPLIDDDEKDRSEDDGLYDEKISME